MSPSALAGASIAHIPGRAPAPGSEPLLARVRARAELVLGPIELHAHRLVSRHLDDQELADARSAAAALTRGLGQLQLHGLAQLARSVESLLQQPNVDAAAGIELAGLVEDIRTMLASAVAQLQNSPALSGTVLAVGEPTAAFDATLWVLSSHGHDIIHTVGELPAMERPPDVVLVSIGDSLDPATQTTLRAIGETWATPAIVFHDDIPLHIQVELARYCSTLLPSSTAPSVASEEIMRLRAIAAADLSATVWRFDDATPVLSAHGFSVTQLRSLAELSDAPYGAIVIGAEAGPVAMADITRLIRVTPTARQAPVVWQGPLEQAHQLVAAQLGALVVDRFDDAAAAELVTELRRATGDTDPTTLSPDTTLNWPAARLLIDRSLIAAQRGNVPAAVALARLPADCPPSRRQELSDLLVREFRRGDVVGTRTDLDFVIALQGIGRRVALDRLSRLSLRLGPDVRIGVAEFPGDGRSAEDLAHAADHAIERAVVADGPAVVTTVWRPAEARSSDVLVVDADAVLGEMLASAFEDRGLAARVMTDGNDALTHLTSAPAEALPKVLMLDVDVGGADGRALLSSLGPTGLLSHTKVVVMSSRGAENDIRMALDLGAADVIRKPFPIALLLHRILTLLAT